MPAYVIAETDVHDQEQYDRWVHDITFHTYVHENIKRFLEGFRYDAHPMSMLCSSIAALSSFYPEAKNIFDADSRRLMTLVCRDLDRNRGARGDGLERLGHHLEPGELLLGKHVCPRQESAHGEDDDDPQRDRPAAQTQ